MARTLTHTLTLSGELVAETPLHIGGADTQHSTDMPLAINGKGEFYLPGTALAGALRAWEGEQGEGKAVWGDAEGDEGHAAYMLVDDAPALDTPSAELWHGVGIDRIGGGAFEGIKFDRQVLPQGTRFKFRLQREVGAGAGLEAARVQMGRLLHALQNGDIRFGGGQTRGHGHLRLERARGSETDWSSRAGILAWLGASQGADALPGWQAAAQAHPNPTHWLEITVHWHPLGPLMSKSARDGLVVDMLPFTSRNHQGELALALPGSAIKGALRSHAERIMRTLLGLSAVQGKHFDQVNVPLANTLFGAARPGEQEDKSQSPGGRGLLAIDTCYSLASLPESRWEALDQQSAPWQTPNEGPLPMSKADHVAIDRWTGAASDGALFSGVEPDKSVRWQPLRLRFDLRRGSKAQAEQALLWLVLRDFAAGRIPLGFGVNRGYGDVAVERIELKGLQALGAADVTLSVHNRQLEACPWAEDLKIAWQAWLNAQPAPQETA